MGSFLWQGGCTSEPLCLVNGSLCMDRLRIACPAQLLVGDKHTKPKEVGREEWIENFFIKQIE